MRFKNYFNSLEKYWSANFLALLSSVSLLSFITWTFINFICFIFQATNFSEYLKLVGNSFPYGIGYTIIFFPLSCFLSVCIFTFYILIIISRKKWCIFTNLLLILIIWSIFFLQYQESLNFEQGTGIYVAFVFLPATILLVPISIGIYLILLLLELIPKFRVPQSPVSQNNIFKKYIRVFYCFYYVMIGVIIGTIIYIISLR